MGLAGQPVDPTSVWLHHKTTRREAYDAALASRPDCDDVVLWNTRGEVTESSIANVVVEHRGRAHDPAASRPACSPASSGPGCWPRGRSARGWCSVGDLAPGRRLWLANSVRGLYEAVYVG